MNGCGKKIGPFDCCTVIVGDCVETMEQLPNGCANLYFADPPYNKGKAEWDKGHDWRTWIPEAVRVLKDNGAFWVIHRDAKELGKISDFIEEQGGPPMINWITWDEWNYERVKVEKGEIAGPLYGALWKQVCKASNRSFGQAAEYLIYHADDGQWQSQCDKVRGFIFEPLRAYLDGERRRAGIKSKEVDTYLGNFMSGHYFGQSQWALPTEPNYRKMQQLFNCSDGHEYLRREYEDLCREYEDLCREYEDLRPTFNNPGGVSSVWQGPIAKRNGHPTPKPGWLLERIIKTTSNPGDLVVDFFMGSGTTAVEAQKLGRHFFGCDIKAEYVEMTNRELSTVQMAMEL